MTIKELRHFMRWCNKQHISNNNTFDAVYDRYLEWCIENGETSDMAPDEKI